MAVLIYNVTANEDTSLSDLLHKIVINYFAHIKLIPCKLHLFSFQVSIFLQQPDAFAWEVSRDEDEPTRSVSHGKIGHAVGGFLGSHCPATQQKSRHLKKFSVSLFLSIFHTSY